MCVVSMVMDHQYNDWNDKWRKIQEQDKTPTPIWPKPQPVPPLSDEEIESFRKLLERAKQYDIDNNEPNCELEEKKKKLLDLAKEMGVEINFL